MSYFPTSLLYRQGSREVKKKREMRETTMVTETVKEKMDQATALAVKGLEI